jgi:hypothetical protein
MKNKLWIFGGSIPTTFTGSDYYHPEEHIFPFILKEKLGLNEVRMLAAPAQCNFVSILKFIHNRDEMQAGDYIVWHVPPFDRWSIFPFEGTDLEYLEDYIVNKTAGITQVLERLNNIKYDWFKKHVVEWLDKNPGITSIFFSDEGQWNSEFNRFNELISFIKTPYGDSYSFQRDWMQNNIDRSFQYSLTDTHLSEKGHRAIAEHILTYINQNK